MPNASIIFNIITYTSCFRMSDTYCGESSKIDDKMDLFDEKELRKSKENTVPGVESSPDLMSGVKAVMIQMVKMLKEGSLTSELLMGARNKQMDSSKRSSKIRTDCDVIQQIVKVQFIVDHPSK